MAVLLSLLSLVVVQQTLAQTAPTTNASGSGLSVPSTPMTNMPSTASQYQIVAPTNFQRTNLTQLNALAVCNDGSTGYYYFRPGTGNGTNKWVIRLEGGGFCSDQQTCTQRALATPNLMSSASQFYPDVLAGASVSGVLDGDLRANPYMYTWNHVSIGYCSSDAYLGNVGPNETPEAGQFQFRGQLIVNTTINSLLLNQNLGTATDILLVGVSAGGIGAMNLADGIYSIIKPAAAALVNYKAYIDAGWFLDINSYSLATSAFTFRKTAQGYYYNFKARFNPACAAAYPTQPWACFFAPSAWSYVQTSLLFHEYLYDAANLGYDAVGSQDNINDFRTRLTASITTAANAIPAVRNDTAPPGLVSAQSFSTSGTPVGSPRSGPPTNSPPPLYAPGAQAVPPVSIIPSPPGVPGPPAAAGPPPPTQTTNATGLPAPKGPIGTAVYPAVFAPACNSHDIADNDLLSVSHIGTVRFTDTLNTWFTTGKANLPLVDPTIGYASALTCLRAI